MIDVKNVVKRYKKVIALDGATFTAKEGRVTALLGINGVGKSTALKAIMGLIPINSGEILIDGEIISHKSYDKIAMVPDTNILFSHMTIREAFEFMSIYYKNWDNEKAYRMLEFFKLTEEKKISDLSKGNKARVKLILGFAQKSKYLLLDEPFSGIDIFTREDFIGAMSGEFIEDGQGLIITTHEIGEIENLAEDVVLLEEGKVIKQFSAEECREEYGKSIMDMMREVYRNA